MDIFELRVLNPSTGVCDIVLPDLAEVTIAPMHSDVGTVQFTYPRRGLNFSQIQNDRELAVYYNGAEIGTLRSTIEQIQYDDANLAEDGDLAKITTRMNISRLDRGIVYPPGWPTVTNPPDQTFTNATPGTIMLTLIAQAQARGTIGYITTSSFTATHDSNGVAWATTITLTITAETDYLSLLQSLISYGLCEAQMNIYDLRLYNFQTLGVDHTVVEPPLVLRKGRDMVQSQVQRQTKGLSTVVLMAGSANLYVEATDAGAIATKGRREIGASQNGVTDSGTLTSLGQTYLGTVSSEIVARTNQVNYGDPTTPLPLRDFNLGDWLYNDVADGNGLTRSRVIQWTFERKGSGELVGNVVCDSIFQEKINRLNGILNAIMNGVTIIGSSQPAPVQKLLYPPKIPTGLAIGSSTYVDGQGITLAIANVTWVPVTQNSNNQPELNLQNYLVKYTVHGASVWSLAAPIDPSVNAANFSPFNCGSVLDFQVGAIDDQGNFSGWSATVTQTMTTDTTPPNQPSTPGVSSVLGQLAVLWNGLDSVGAGMPGDFALTRVHVSSAGSSFTPSTANLVGTLQGAGTLNVSGANLVYGTTYWVKLVALDRSGNASTPSVAGSAVLSQVVNTDIATGQVGLNNLSFSDVGNLVDNGSFEDPAWRAIRNTAFGGSHFGFDNTTSSAGNWSVIHTGFSGGTEQVILSTINAKVGQVLMGAADVKMTSAVTSAMFVALGVNWLDKTGATIGSTVNLMTNWSSPSTNDNTWRTRISSSGQTAPANTVQAQIVLASTTHTAGSVWFDNVEVRMQMDNLLIADAAITNAKINDVSANKITAGTITAGIILANTFATAASGGRVVLDGGADAFEVFDSGGNQIGKWDPGAFTIYNGPHTGIVRFSTATSTGLTPFMVWDVGSGFSTQLPTLYVIQQSNHDGFTIQGPSTTIDPGVSSITLDFNGGSGTAQDDAYSSLFFHSSTTGRGYQVMRWDKKGVNVSQVLGGISAPTTSPTIIQGSVVQNTDVFGLDPRFVHFGTFGSSSTDGAGNLTISHGAGFTPTGAVVMYNQTGAGGGPFCAGVFNFASSTFGTHWESNGASYNSSTLAGGCYMVWV